MGSRILSILFFVFLSIPLTMSIGQDIQTGDEPVIEYDDGGDGSDPPYPLEISDVIELLQSVNHWSITQQSMLERIDSRLEEQNRELLVLDVSLQYAVGLLAFLSGVLTALVFLLGLKLR